MSITISEGSPYNISIVGVGPIDIHRRVVHNLKKNTFVLKIMFLIRGLGKCEGVGEDSGHGLVI